jgi:hypothetical protein
MFQKEISVSDGVDGFDGCIEVVQRTRRYRSWADDAKARIVAESFQSGVDTTSPSSTRCITRSVSKVCLVTGPATVTYYVNCMGL